MIKYVAASSSCRFASVEFSTDTTRSSAVPLHIYTTANINMWSRSGANTAPTNTTKPSLQTPPPALFAAAVFACGGDNGDWRGPVVESMLARQPGWQAPRNLADSKTKIPTFLVDWMFLKAKIFRLNTVHRLQELQSNWFWNNLITSKLAIKFVVFWRNLRGAVKNVLADFVR